MQFMDFTTIEKKTEPFRPYIRCEICINADCDDIHAPRNYIRCKKYNMYSKNDMTCKAGVKKDGK